MEWFSLTGPDPTESSDYSLANPTPPIGCTGTNQICAVQATNNGNNEPELDDTLKNEMILALHSRSPLANVKLKT